MVDVLNLEWTSYSSRDRNVASLVCNYLRLRGFTVIEGSIFNGFKLIDELRPTLLFITNGVGARINFEIVKYASAKGIKVLTLVSEGNYVDDINRLDQFLWGWNCDKVLYESIQCQWSERTRNLTLSKYPELKSKIRVSGSCGSDIYKIKACTDKSLFLRKFQKQQFSKIIGMGCWDFGFCFKGGRGYEESLNLYGDAVLARFKEDRDKFNSIVLEAIKCNPDVLFLLKEHPGNISDSYMSAINGCEKYDNVLILKNTPIVDCISVSDFWVTYESTTVFEAWALNKQTCLINPSGINFPRANVYLGSPNFCNSVEFCKSIDFFYKNGVLPGYDEKHDERVKAISETVQWMDGLNHVRVGNTIIELLKSDTQIKKRNVSLKTWKTKIWQQFLINFKIKSSTFTRYSSFKESELYEFDRQLMNEQKRFYLSFSIDYLNQIQSI